jgi:hypothetical protein
MILLAHIMMIPVEELLPLASGAGAGMVLWLQWTTKRARFYRR